jgi:hypothetical protein
MIGDVLLVKLVEIMNQLEVSRAGAICLPEDFFLFLIAFRVDSFGRKLMSFLASGRESDYVFFVAGCRCCC